MGHLVNIYHIDFCSYLFYSPCLLPQPPLQIIPPLIITLVFTTHISDDLNRKIREGKTMSHQNAAFIVRINLCPAQAKWEKKLKIITRRLGVSTWRETPVTCDFPRPFGPSCESTHWPLSNQTPQISLRVFISYLLWRESRAEPILRNLLASSMPLVFPSLTLWSP